MAVVVLNAIYWPWNTEARNEDTQVAVALIDVMVLVVAGVALLFALATLGTWAVQHWNDD
jgi:hypothetical protein